MHRLFLFPLGAAKKIVRLEVGIPSRFFRRSARQTAVCFWRGNRPPTGAATRPVLSAHFGFEDFWAVKIDSIGEKMWEQSYGGSGVDWFYQAVATPDGGFLLAGDSTSFADGNKTSPPLNDLNGDAWPVAGADVWVVRIDSEGRKLWDRYVGSTRADGLSKIQATRDGGAMVTGRSVVDGFWGWWGPLEHFAVRLDSAGNERWRHSFGTNSFFVEILEMSDGGFIVGGGSSSGTNQFKSSPSFGSTDCWLVRLDSSGNKLWDLSLGGRGEDFFSTIAQTKDGGFILGIASTSGADGNKTTPGYGDYDLWAVKLGPEPPPDSDGDGVPDAEDLCPGTLLGAIVNANGCSSGQLVPCTGPWTSHGEYLRDIVKVSGQFRRAGLITHEQRLATFMQTTRRKTVQQIFEWKARDAASVTQRLSFGLGWERDFR